MTTLVMCFREEKMKKPDKTRKEHAERKNGSWEKSEKARHQEGGEDLQCQKQETIIAQILALSYSCHRPS